MKAGSGYKDKSMNDFKKTVWSWLPGLLALVVLLLVYLWSLQTDINGGSHDYVLDAGEIQVALNLWGTVHYTGYPHYTILSALLTRFMVGLGVIPAAAASATSLLWTLLALLIFYRLLTNWLTKGNNLLAGLMVLVVGVMETFWLHSVIAEVYSFSLLLVCLTIFLGMRLRERWRFGEWLITIFVVGMAVAHHRILLILGPMVVIMVWDDFWHWLWQDVRHIFYGTAALLAPFAAYIYLPLRAWQGTLWVYGQPGTWPGFWQQFTGSEVAGGLLRPPSDYQGWVDNLYFLNEHLAFQAPWLLLLIGLIGLLWLTHTDRHFGLTLLLGTGVLVGFVFLFPSAVWAPAVLMPPLLFLAAGVTFLLHRLAQIWPIAGPVSWVGLLVLGSSLLASNRSLVTELTRDPGGREMITLLQRLSEETDSDTAVPTLALPWGTDFFAASYGLYVTKELSGFNLVDHRADFAAIIENEGIILTPASYVNYWPPERWEAIVGEVTYAAITPNIVAIQRQSLYEDVPLNADFALGNGIRIRSTSVTQAESRIALTVYWEAMQVLLQDYSVAVHLITRFPPQQAEDIVAQADAMHPVRGWYPTSQWSPEEIVRDQYELTIPIDAGATAVALTMYHVDETGQFVNNAWYIVTILD
jgi:hypothetical protein